MRGILLENLALIVCLSPYWVLHLSAYFYDDPLSRGSWKLALRPALYRCAALMFAVIVFAEVWAGSQELEFYLRHRNDSAGSPVVSEPRWWPFESHEILYNPSTGAWGGRD